MKKKFLAMFLVTTMSATVLAGCGGNSSETSESAANQSENAGSEEADSDASEGEAQAEEASETSGETVELDFWYSGGKTAVNVFQEIVDEFNDSQSTYHINTVTQADYTETYQKLQAGIAGGNAPDMALLDVDKARNLSNKELVADITPFIEADAEFDQTDYLEVFFNQGYDKNNRLFAMPAYGTTQIMYYNMAAFEAAGVNASDVKTWQDLEEAAKKIAALDEYEVGWEPMWGPYNLVDASLSNGGSILSEDGTTVMINSPEWVEVWESVRTWIHDDKIMKINSGGQGWEYWYKTIDDVLQNAAGGYTGSSGDQADLDFSIVAAMEQPGWGENPSAPTADALQLVMLESSSEAEKQGVYEFMKYFTSPENQAKWSMSTGYVAVRKSTQDVEEFAAYCEENPQALVPLQQASHGSILPEDPTGGKIYDALTVACDKVEIEGVSAQEALDEAQKTAQAALDEVLGK